LTVSVAVAATTSRSEALFVLNGLLNNEAEARHPEEFKILINAYFSGVKYLQEDKVELAEKYFSLVKKYGEILTPYFTEVSQRKTNTVPKFKIATPGPALRNTQAADTKAASSPEQGKELLKIEKEGVVPPQLKLAVASAVPLPPAVLPIPSSTGKPPSHTKAEFKQNIPNAVVLALDPGASPGGAGGSAQHNNQSVRSKTEHSDPVLKEAVVSKVDPAGMQPESDDESSSEQQTVKSVAGQTSNPPASGAKLNYGLALKIVNRHIIPKIMTDGLLINVADCTLYFFKDGRLKSQLPVVVGRAKSSEVRSWQTPLGNFKVTEKIKNPTWHIPQSIQKEMEDAGQEVQIEIPPGPDNPLGKYAIRTSLPGILIHGTNVSSFKNCYRSHGCIRVSASKIESLFNEIKIDTAGEIIYRPIKISANDDGKIFLEVHKDSYGNIKDMRSKVRETIKGYKLESSVNWKKVNRTVKEKSGFAEDVSL